MWELGFLVDMTDDGRRSLLSRLLEYALTCQNVTTEVKSADLRANRCVYDLVDIAMCFHGNVVPSG